LRNIPALHHHCGANLLHCRSPFYLCLEHVDNLGAYTASRPETGLLIPSGFEGWPAKWPLVGVTTPHLIEMTGSLYCFDMLNGDRRLLRHATGNRGEHIIRIPADQTD